MEQPLKYGTAIPFSISIHFYRPPPGLRWFSGCSCSRIGIGIGIGSSTCWLGPSSGGGSGITQFSSNNCALGTANMDRMGWAGLAGDERKGSGGGIGGVEAEEAGNLEKELEGRRRIEGQFGVGRRKLWKKKSCCGCAEVKIGRKILGSVWIRLGRKCVARNPRNQISRVVGGKDQQQGTGKEP
jgi:hypothetical protein